MMQTPPRKFLFLPGLLFLGGCAHGPAFDVFGSYFPAWMACLLTGITATIFARLLLLGLGIDAHLRPKLVVYPCLVVVFTLAVWLIFFKI